jgi:hypothetical protein
MISIELIDRLTQPAIQEFVRTNENLDENNLLLAHRDVLGIPTSILVTQLIGRRKTKYKLPAWYTTSNILYPPATNLAQSSSEATGKFKSAILQLLLTDFERMVDLTGGFGVDSYYLGSHFKEVVWVDPYEELKEIVSHNHKQLGARNIHYVTQTAEEFLSANVLKTSLYYLDPSRRVDSGKVVKLMDCMPNALNLLDSLLIQCPYLLIKASPLLDIHQGLVELKYVEKVFVVSVENECKELLFFIRKEFEKEPTIEAVDLTSSGEIVHSFSFLSSEEAAVEINYSPPQEYLYEPNASIMKAGAFKLVAKRYGIKKISRNTHFYTSQERMKNFPGRVFKIEKINPGKEELKQFFPEGKANVIIRNYPLSAEALKRKLKLSDGGDKYVIGFSEQNRKTIIIASRL